MTFCEPCVCELPTIENVDAKMSIYQCFNFCIDFFGVNEEYVLKRNRKRERVLTRQMCMYAATIFTGLSLKDVGAKFGGFDHSTVIHAKNTIDDLCDTDEYIRDTFESLKKYVTQNFIKLKLKAA